VGKEARNGLFVALDELQLVPGAFAHTGGLFPQGLKPASLLALSGAAEAVPFTRTSVNQSFSDNRLVKGGSHPLSCFLGLVPLDFIFPDLTNII
jgi:hypothetical protein